MKQDLSKRSSYFYHLPAKMIAQFPLAERSESRLLVLDKKLKAITHRKFSDIIEYFHQGDVLVLNETRVIPARLYGRKNTGAEVEIFLLDQIDHKNWECLVKPGRRLKPGSKVDICEELKAEIIDYSEEGGRIVHFDFHGEFFELLQKYGKVPLPPYINRDANDKDKETYQTVYAKIPGSVAAPTAGLHFTKKLLDKIRDKGITITSVQLNVGLGTFRPVQSENITDHKMHSEFCSINSKVAVLINQAKKEKRRIISVGTTSTRTLESFAENGKLRSGSHYTDIFIYPGGRKFEIVDCLITNFHLPESTLLMLVSALAGYENIMKAYQEAIAKDYRFFSYGDAMLII